MPDTRGLSGVAPLIRSGAVCKGRVQASRFDWSASAGCTSCARRHASKHARSIQVALPFPASPRIPRTQTREYRRHAAAPAGAS